MTDPTADDAKLLPCPTFWVVERFENERSAGYWSGGNSRAFLTDIEKAVHFCRREDAMWTIIGWHWGDVQITEHAYVENTRPQPAPPAGEPDWEQVIEQAFFVLSIKTLNRDEFRAELIALARHAYGLAARPKVDDAEVEAAITYLGDEVPEEKAIADLLERLAGEAADNLKAAQGMSADVTNIGQQLQDAEAKLADTQAELAKADAVIVKLTPLIPPQWSDNGSWTANDQAVCENAHVQHAARQQQKDKPNE